MHAGLTDLLCIVLDQPPDNRERLALQVIENLLREDLAPVEQARAYQELMRLNGWGTNQLARELHIPASAISQALSLLELPAPIQERIDAGELAAWSATSCRSSTTQPARPSWLGASSLRA